MLWIAFGTGSNFHYIPVNKVAAAMDPRVCATSTHSRSVILRTSSFGGRGKKTAWNTWKVLPEVTAAFVNEDLLHMQENIGRATISTLARKYWIDFATFCTFNV